MKRPRVAVASALASVLALASIFVLANKAGPADRTGRPAPALAVAAAPGAVPADSPAGFWYGTDSWPMTISGKPPYSTPRIGSPYGGYIGMAGNWAKWVGCGGRVAWSSANSNAANVNFTKYHQGIGTGVYWFMGGPGVDPRYNGTASEASAWGVRQAAETLHLMAGLHVTYPVVFMDIELPGIGPALDNGWNAVYTSPCSGIIKRNFVPTNIDRAEFNGYRAYLISHSHYKPGVYSAPSIWASIFGTRSDAYIPTTDEWTYTAFTSSLSRLPSGWCLRGTRTCAQFFGGVTSSSPHALMWQWSGGGGSFNGFGDFDQIDKNRQS